jgi:hypothetical protein
MAQIRKGDLCAGRVLHEDGDFVTMEVAKRDDISFRLQQNEDGETVGGDRFFTLLFVRAVDGGMEVWKPWEAED